MNEELAHQERAGTSENDDEYVHIMYLYVALRHFTNIFNSRSEPNGNKRARIE